MRPPRNREARRRLLELAGLLHDLGLRVARAGLMERAEEIAHPVHRPHARLGNSGFGGGYPATHGSGVEALGNPWNLWRRLGGRWKPCGGLEKSLEAVGRRLKSPWKVSGGPCKPVQNLGGPWKPLGQFWKTLDKRLKTLGMSRDTFVAFWAALGRFWPAPGSLWKVRTWNFDCA